MGILPTIKIKDPVTEGEFVVINESDFDAGVHELFEEKPAKPAKAKTATKAEKAAEKKAAEDAAAAEEARVAEEKAAEDAKAAEGDDGKTAAEEEGDGLDSKTKAELEVMLPDHDLELSKIEGTGSKGGVKNSDMVDAIRAAVAAKEAEAAEETE